MTITKQTIDSEIALLKANASDCHVRTKTVEMLEGIWARVEELEAKPMNDLKSRIADYLVEKTRTPPEELDQLADDLARIAATAVSQEMNKWLRSLPPSAPPLE